MVPKRVVPKAKRKRRERKRCRVGYRRYRMMAMWGQSSQTMSKAPGLGLLV